MKLFKNYLKIMTATVSLLFFVIFNSKGQFRQDVDKANLYNLGKKFYSELHYFPTGNKDTIKAIALFRFTNDMIPFEKFSLSNSSQNKFISIPKIEIEFKDKEGIIRHNEIWQDTIIVDSFEKTISNSDFIIGAISCNLLFNNYDIDIRLTDKTNQTIKKVTHKDSLTDFYKKPTIGRPIFVDVSDYDNQEYFPFILRNKISFTAKNPHIIIPVSFNNEFAKYNYSCKFNCQNNKNEFKWKSDFNVNSVAIPAKNYSINIIESDIKKITLKQEKSSDVKLENVIFLGLLNISIPNDALVPGEYELKVVEDKSNDTLKFNFEVIWEEMPVSLQKPKFAIESMYYILNDDEYKKMLYSKDEEYSSKIINWWKKEDPTPSTIYNESMAEYFKRVDYAMFNLKSLSEPNGVKSDRGKIYILYGPPTNNERKLSENKALEIWKYEHLKKLFIFETLSNDVYKLVEIKNY